MFDHELADSGYWSTWGVVSTLTIKQAAWLLCNQDPDNTDQPNMPTPSGVKAIRIALLESLANGELVPLRHYENCGYGPVLVNSKREEADESSTEVRTEELTRWADMKQLRHGWRNYMAHGIEGFDPSRYPPEIRTAIEAHDAVRYDEKALAGKSPKKALLTWLKSNHSNLSTEAQNRIATMSNWDPQGGAPKTPPRR